MYRLRAARLSGRGMKDGIFAKQPRATAGSRSAGVRPTTVDEPFASIGHTVSIAVGRGQRMIHIVLCFHVFLAIVAFM
jgi:hypothetical protein